MIELFTDDLAGKRDIFSALKRTNITRVLIDIPEQSFLMIEAAKESSFHVETRKAFHDHLASLSRSDFVH